MYGSATFWPKSMIEITKLNSGRLPPAAIFQSPSSGWIWPEQSVRDVYLERAPFPEMSMTPQLARRRWPRPH